jgi:hypothetical protein
LRTYSSASASLRHCSGSNPSDTIQCLFETAERQPSADGRNPAPQHSVRKSRAIHPAKTQ